MRNDTNFFFCDVIGRCWRLDDVHACALAFVSVIFFLRKNFSAICNKHTYRNAVLVVILFSVDQTSVSSSSKQHIHGFLHHLWLAIADTLEIATIRSSPVLGCRNGLDKPSSTAQGDHSEPKDEPRCTQWLNTRHITKDALLGGISFTPLEHACLLSAVPTGS